MLHYRDNLGSHFSFLPTHSKTGYECLLGAIEMGYSVDGYLVITQDTLVNFWSIDKLDHATIWHGNEHLRNLTTDVELSADDPDAEKIASSAHGILQALEFLENVLLDGRAEAQGADHGHGESRRIGRRLHKRSVPHVLPVQY